MNERKTRSALAYKVARLSLKELLTTLTEDSAIAAAAMMGESSIPNTG